MRGFLFVRGNRDDSLGRGRMYNGLDLRFLCHSGLASTVQYLNHKKDDSCLAIFRLALFTYIGTQSPSTLLATSGWFYVMITSK